MTVGDVDDGTTRGRGAGSGTGRPRAGRGARARREDARRREPALESLSGRRRGGLTATARRGRAPPPRRTCEGNKKFGRDGTHRARRATRLSPRRREEHLRTHPYTLPGGVRRTPASSTGPAACGKALFGRARRSRIASAEKNASGERRVELWESRASFSCRPRENAMVEWKSASRSVTDGVALRVRLRAYRRDPPPRAALAPASTPRSPSPRRRRRPADPPRVRCGAVPRRGVSRDGRTSRRRAVCGDRRLEKRLAVQPRRGDGRGSGARRVLGDAFVRRARDGGVARVARAAESQRADGGCARRRRR